MLCHSSAQSIRRSLEILDSLDQGCMQLTGSNGRPMQCITLACHVCSWAINAGIRVQLGSQKLAQYALAFEYQTNRRSLSLAFAGCSETDAAAIDAKLVQ